MLFSDIALLDENLDVCPHMSVLVEDSRIKAIMPSDTEKSLQISQLLPPYEIYNGHNKLLMSGFFNGHSHLPMSILRGYGENLPLDRWLNDRIFPFEAQLTGRDVYWSSLLGIAEMLRFGIVSSSDMYFYLSDMIEAFKVSGAKGSLCRAASNTSGEGYLGSVQHSENEDIWKQYCSCCDDRIRLDLSLHAEYTSNERFVRELAEYAHSLGARIQVHVSETASEVAACRDRHNGLSPVAYLADCGLFDNPTLAAHCVHISNDDCVILKEKNVSVATCPKSNLKLASGVCDVPRLQKFGINCCLGTDSVASNNNLNMLEEIRFMSLLPKGVQYDPTLLTPQQSIFAATRAGALAQGRDDCGLLKEGFRADLIVLDIEGPHWQPQHDLLNNLVYSADGSDVVLTMVDGKVLYKDGEYLTIDPEQITSEVERSRQRILHQL